MENELYQVQKTTRIYQTFLNNLICCFFYNKQRSYHEEISEKKKQSQVQTIQRTVSSRNVTQDNDIMKKFWKGSRWFRRHCLRTFLLFLTNRIKKMTVWKTTFLSEHLKTDQSLLTEVFCTRCTLCLLQS